MNHIQGEQDARSGVLRYTISGTIHRARLNTEAEAVLWCAQALLHRAMEFRRQHVAAGSPPPPPGVSSLTDIAECWEGRVRRMVRLATTAEGYEGSDTP